MGSGLKFGADPEFGFKLKRTGGWRVAKDIIHDFDPHGYGTAIGLDGDRPTASIELRPGVASNAAELVNRMGDLLMRLHEHYHPKGVAYTAGPWLPPEPLGGHIHISWTPKRYVSVEAFEADCGVVTSLVTGLAELSDRVIPELYSTQSVLARRKYAADSGRDFASPTSTRPSSLNDILKTGHVEYRYPPSWLASPEEAYLFIGSAQVIAEIAFAKNTKPTSWANIINDMLVCNDVKPDGCPSIAKAWRVALRYKCPEDFMDNWL